MKKIMTLLIVLAIALAFSVAVVANKYKTSDNDKKNHESDKDDEACEHSEGPEHASDNGKEHASDDSVLERCGVVCPPGDVQAVGGIIPWPPSDGTPCPPINGVLYHPDVVPGCCKPNGG